MVRGHEPTGLRRSERPGCGDTVPFSPCGLWSRGADTNDLVDAERGVAIGAKSVSDVRAVDGAEDGQCVRNMTSVTVATMNTRLTTPFKVKNATPTRDRSFARTMECSYSNSAITATTPV